MAARPLLVVLIVRDAGLRSALAARLSKRFDLLTAARWEDVADRRLIRSPSVLVADGESFPGLDLEQFAEDRGFARIVALLAGDVLPEPGRRLIHISPKAAIESLSQLFTDLIDADQSAPPREA
jgi:hypothetical protein